MVPARTQFNQVLNAARPNDRDGVSEGQFNQALSTGHKPHKIIFYRDGVSESQFNQVLNIELDQMIEGSSGCGRTSLVVCFIFNLVFRGPNDLLIIRRHKGSVISAKNGT